MRSAVHLTGGRHTISVGGASRHFRLHGGPGRDRTDDLFHAMEAPRLGAEICVGAGGSQADTGREPLHRHPIASAEAGGDAGSGR